MEGRSRPADSAVVVCVSLMMCWKPRCGRCFPAGHDYASAAKPQIDGDDADAQQALIDSRARDAYACLSLLDGRQLDSEAAEAAELLARVVGQDLEATDDGSFRIARKVAKDRVVSTVDPGREAAGPAGDRCAGRRARSSSSSASQAARRGRNTRYRMLLAGWPDFRSCCSAETSGFGV
jgi:hypothetical protein